MNRLLSQPLSSSEEPMISVITPIYNEELNVPILYARLTIALESLGRPYEIIAVDDGSRDGSRTALKALAQTDARLKLIFLRNNFGQTAALAAGIEAANGEHIVLIDSDLENDPADIGTLIGKLEEGYQVVSGWRKDRWAGQTMTRKIPSRTANWLISKIAGLPLNDYGCTLKAYHRDVIQGIPLYGEMHRFIPAYAAQRGARVAEVEVQYTPRQFGKSNYGLSRVIRVLPDLLLLRFLDKYMDRPMHFFGLVGFYAFGAGLLSIIVALYLRIFMGISLIQTPLPTLAAMCMIVGVLLFLMGIVAEMIMRTYYESQGKRPYAIKERHNFE
jgi:glycosyltransferase involved in cell wall biosynthesis